MKTRRETLEDFVAQDPDDSFSRYAFALELEKEGRELESIQQLQEVIARDPSYVPAYYHLGRLLARRGQIEDARAVYRLGLDAATASKDQRTRGELQEALDLLD
jgi:thioredoxin-like negative regulator of GroEL